MNPSTRDTIVPIIILSLLYLYINILLTIFISSLNIINNNIIGNIAGQKLQKKL